jgi:D-alanyl-D-alanine carboxypeptidase
MPDSDRPNALKLDRRTRMFDNTVYLYRLMIRGISLLVLLCLLAPCTLAVQSTNTKKNESVSRAAAPARPEARLSQKPRRARVPRRSRPPKARLRPLQHFDPTQGDNVDGDDLEVRRAAVEALGPFDGTVVVVDPQTGRILTMVNQKTALDSGFTPCSTIKLVTAFAALNEGLVGAARRCG